MVIQIWKQKITSLASSGIVFFICLSIADANVHAQYKICCNDHLEFTEKNITEHSLF